MTPKFETYEISKLKVAPLFVKPVPANNIIGVSDPDKPPDHKSTDSFHINEALVSIPLLTSIPEFNIGLPDQVAFKVIKLSSTTKFSV